MTYMLGRSFVLSLVMQGRNSDPLQSIMGTIGYAMQDTQRYAAIQSLDLTVTYSKRLAVLFVHLPSTYQAEYSDKLQTKQGLPAQRNSFSVISQP